MSFLFVLFRPYTRVNGGDITQEGENLLEGLGIMLGFHSERVFDMVKSGRQVQSSGEKCGPGQRSGCWPPRCGSPHCGKPRVSPSGIVSPMKGEEGSGPELWEASVSTGPARKGNHTGHGPVGPSGQGPQPRASPRY